MNNERFITYTAAQLRDELVSVTLGSGANIDVDKVIDVFAEYIRRALPGVDVRALRPFRTTAALNSVAGTVRMMREGTELVAFVKIHIESDTKCVSAVGVAGEYRNADLLARAGWPVLVPLEIGTDPDYPLLVYPEINAPTLFQLLETSYEASNIDITPGDLTIVERLHQQIGRATYQSLCEVDRADALHAPVQHLFLRRFERGGRIDQWYQEETEFLFPGLTQPILWKDLLRTQWVINGKRFATTIEDMIARARRSLSFGGDKRTVVAISHGDDHAGNIFMERESQSGLVFDPAFAGRNPISLCDLKAFAHTGFLPMAGLYYDPKFGTCRYAWDEGKNLMSVEIDFRKTPLYPVHETIARQIMNERIAPLYHTARSRYGVAMVRERERMMCGLFGCALLTINASMLLKKNDGRGRGLLPMAMMFAELKGLPVLEELDQMLMGI